jgi:hypothetical protein
VGRLTITQPVWARRLKWLAWRSDWVMIPAVRPYSVSLSVASASSKSRTRITQAMGPNTSSRLMRMSLRLLMNKAGRM